MVVPAQAEENPWSRPTCIFGMPNIGHAVQRGQTGLITDILNAVYKREGVVFRHETMPYARALQALAVGKIQCTLDVGKQKIGLQPKSIIAFYDLSVAFMRGTEWKGPESLRGKKVAYLHGFDIAKILKLNVVPQLVYDLTSAFHMLDRGFASYILDDGRLLKDALFESRLPSYEFEVEHLKTFEVRPIFADTPDGRKFLEIYDRRIPEMIETGELDEIFTRYDLKKETKRVAKANGM